MRKAIILVVLLVGAAVAVGKDAPTLPAKKSADGLEFPKAEARKFNGNLPIIHDALGSRPDEVPIRWFSSTASQTILEKKANDLGGNIDWFALGGWGADAIGAKVNRGRIISVELIFRKVTDQRAGSLREELRKTGEVIGDDMYQVKATNYTANVLLVVTGHDLSATFAVPTLDWVVAYADLSETTARNLKARHIVKGMLSEHAELVLADVFLHSPYTFREVFKSEGEGVEIVRWELSYHRGIADEHYRTIEVRSRSGIVESVTDTRDESVMRMRGIPEGSVVVDH